MEGFASLESAERFSRLLVGCYRFKRFTDSCRRDGNGKSPLQLAGVDTEGTDWLRFLLATEDDGSRDEPLMGQNIISGTTYELDFDALRAASIRIVPAHGAESAGEMANRAAAVVAERLGTSPVVFPSHHGGFLGGEYGCAGELEAFAAKLREVLSAPA